MRTAVVVLGDLGRSPRMQYHALQLAVGGEVDLIGLAGTPPHAAVTSHPRIRCHIIADRRFATRTERGRGWFVGMSAARAGMQAVALLSTLLRLPRPDAILVQNPPAVPTLAVAWLAARVRGARLVIDWHNLAHTVLAVRLGDRHRAVRALERSERRWARRADAHLAVSGELSAWLRRQWAVRAVVVRDRPSTLFTPSTSEAAAEIWQRLTTEWGLGPARLPLVLCPTSWSYDEDFDLLLEALERAERSLGPASPGWALAVVLTGRGERRAEFEQRVARRTFHRVLVRTAWLPAEDYRTLVGMADAGLCLHQSTSGLDLPMKLADFRGAGVPVLALDYGPVLNEVLTAGHEGLSFRDPGHLAASLTALASGQGDSARGIEGCRRWLAAYPAVRWEDEWNTHAAPVVHSSAEPLR